MCGNIIIASRLTVIHSFFVDDGSHCHAFLGEMITLRQIFPHAVHNNKKHEN